MPLSAVEPVHRERPAEAGSERETLLGTLDFLRSTVVNKVAGLTNAQALDASVEPSKLTPASIVKHLTGVERFWFSIDFADADVAWPWLESEPHGNFPLDVEDLLSTLVADYLSECERSRQAYANSSLGDIARGEGMRFNLRHAIVHMIEETSRHCGHLDLLRERIDGSTGE